MAIHRQVLTIIGDSRYDIVTSGRYRQSIRTAHQHIDRVKDVQRLPIGVDILADRVDLERVSPVESVLPI
jgi:hypothetical protein